MNQKTVKKYSSLAFKKYRKKYGLFLAEGFHVVNELLKSDWEIQSVLTSDNKTYGELQGKNRIWKIELVKPSIIEKIAEAKTPQEILAVVVIPPDREETMVAYNRVIIADGIKDPGNMGTVIRTARAFGFEAAVTTSRSADIFNPKVVRATQGALFGIEIIPDVSIEIIRDKIKSTHTLYALDPAGNIDINEIEPDDRLALIVGSEIEGIDESLLKAADYRIRISHSGSVDSLNAAVAGGIAMHKFSSGSKTRLS